jgi:hypothetical protein
MDGFMMLRYTALTFALILLSGCKVAVIVVEGGEVLFGDITGSGETCTAGTICFQEVQDTSVSSIYYAQPDEGWEFVQWSSGPGFWCQGSKHPLCELSLEPLAGVPEEEALVATDSTFYVMPIFQRIPPTVIVDGNEWYQPTFFKNLSWYEVNSACPAGVCSGTLNGYDLTGWTWASRQDMRDLFTYYLAPNKLGVNNDVSREVDSSWAPAFFTSGWRWHGGLYSLPHSLDGWIAAEQSPERGAVAFIVDREVGEEDLAVSWSSATKEASNELQGAWFYRPAP